MTGGIRKVRALFDHPAAPRVIPFAVFIAFIVIGSVLPEAPGGWDTRYLFMIRALVVMALLVFFWRRYAELRDFALSWRQWAIAVLSGLAVFVLWIKLDFPWARLGESTVFDPTRADGGIDWVLAAFRLLGLALVVPVMEELFWRSFVMRWIDRHDFLEQAPRAVTLRAIVLTSVVFATEHQLLLGGLIAGLVYAMLYVRTGNLWVPVISHTVTNGVLGVWILATGNWRYW